MLCHRFRELFPPLLRRLGKGTRPRIPGAHTGSLIAEQEPGTAHRGGYIKKLVYPQPATLYQHLHDRPEAYHQPELFKQPSSNA